MNDKCYEGRMRRSLKKSIRVKGRFRTALVLVITSALGMHACRTSPHVFTRVADGVHLEHYKTYTVRVEQTAQSEEAKTSDRAGAGYALNSDVREELQHRGLKPVETNPDLTFSYTAARRTATPPADVWPLIHPEAHDRPYQEGAINLVATDSAGRVVWSAHLQAVIDPTDKTHHQLKDAIAAAFKDYPSVSQN